MDRITRRAFKGNWSFFFFVILLGSIVPAIILCLVEPDSFLLIIPLTSFNITALAYAIMYLIEGTISIEYEVEDAEAVLEQHDKKYNKS